jgi:hypothetical protein
MDKSNTAVDIVAAYLKLVAEHKTLPTYAMFRKHEISRDMVKHHFGNLTSLHEYMRQTHTEDMKKYIVTTEHIFSSIKLTELEESVKKFQRFVVTTYVNNKGLDLGFLASIRNYCAMNDAKLIIIPCDDVASTKAKNDQWVFPPELINDHFVFQDLKLNDNLFISSIRVSAKQINPTTGLGRIGQRNGSYIFAAPKQHLEYVVTSTDNEKLPHALMTTGAISVSDYSTDKYMSERTSYIAQSDHTIGAIVVEIESDKIFHFRQIQADDTGSFVDLGVKYGPDITVAVPTHLVLGDWHVGSTDPTVKECLVDMCKTLNVKNMYLHDFFDGKSINHHDINDPLKLARKKIDRQSSLEEEILAGRDDIKWLLSLFKGDLVMVKGNHDEFLDRYLSRAGYVHDAENHYLSLKLAMVMLEMKDPIQYAYEELNLTQALRRNMVDNTAKSRIIWLKRDEEMKIGGIELGAHGDLGLNGSRGSPRGAERAYGNCVIAHTHSAHIMRGVYRVGTSTYLKLDYNRGPSSWTQTHCLVYENGSRQLVNIINGKWKL